MVNLLDKELGISPNEAIQQLYHEVMAKDRSERKIKQFLRNTDHFCAEWMKSSVWNLIFLRS